MWKRFFQSNHVSLVLKGAKTHLSPVDIGVNLNNLQLQND